MLLGSKMVSAWTDPTLSSHAKAAMEKIEAVLPSQLKQLSEQSPYLVASFNHGAQQQAFSELLRDAINAHYCVELQYQDANEAHSQRIIEPLGMVYWGGKWTLVAYCQLRNDYREFRLDRMLHLSATTTAFATCGNKNLEHYVALVRAKYASQTTP
ncbi:MULTISPECIES: helix-turn-helix transcriptional regulator [Pseudoalteromonas]|uniref:helix-turn-helix transcriptional regulator n=1 Tax=Pseudoalteromonas TaxID=53246 RepID=UPI001F0B6C38|nr:MULTISPECIES: WYL domain-containing protein [Pseudoalteromonas]